MTLSLATTWLERARRTPKDTTFLVTITKGANTWKFLDKPSTIFHYPIGVDTVDSFSAKVDVLTRKSEISEQSVTFRDPALRAIYAANRLFGGKLTIELGFSDLSEADYADYWSGVISSVKVNDERTGITIEGLSIMEILKQHRVVGAWFAKHPLDVIYDILTNTDTARGLGLDASVIDAASFDPDDAANVSFGHFLGGWYNGHGFTRSIVEPTPALELVDQLMGYLPGMLRISETGVIGFKAFDASAAEVATWTTDHISKLKQVSQDEAIINQVNWGLSAAFHEYDQGRARALDPEHGFQRNDTASQTALTFPNVTSRVIGKDFDGSYIVAGGRMLGASTSGSATNNAVSASDTNFIISNDQNGPLGNMCGTRESLPGPQPSTAAIGAARPLYLLTDRGEIIKITSLTSVTSSSTTVTDYGNVSVTDVRHYKTWLVQGATRGYGGTTAAAVVFVFDITIPVILSEMVLKRHSYGLPIIEVTTSLAEWATQYGDFVRVTWPDYLNFSYNGLLSTDGTWEVVSKKYDPDSPEAGITWQLAWAAEGSPTSSFVGYYAQRKTSTLSIHGMQATTMAEQDVAQRYIPEGLEITHHATNPLDVVISEGWVANGTYRTEFIGTNTITLTASKDNYITADLAATAFHVYEVTPGGDAPTFEYGDTEVLLGLVRTNASNAYSIVTDNRTTAPLLGSRIAALSMNGTQLAASSITATTLADNAVTARAIEPSAVQTTHVSPAAIGPAHIVTTDKKPGMFTNAQFSIATVAAAVAKTTYGRSS